MSRLTILRTRKGNTGFTELIKGHRMPKSDALCFINNEIQKAAILIQLWVKKYGSLLDAQDTTLLSKLVNPELGKLTGSLWAKIEMNQLVPLPETILQYETRLSEINSTFQSAQEFIVFDSEAALELYYATLFIRNIEHFVWCIVHRFYGYAIENFTDDVSITGSMYNLLGDYMFTLCRLIEKKLSDSKEQYWQNPLKYNQTDEINT